MGKVFGILALITGVFGLAISAGAAVLDIWSLIPLMPTVLPIISITGWILPVIAIILGIIGISVDDSKGKAITGLIFGILGLTLRILMSYFLAAFLSSLTP